MIEEGRQNNNGKYTGTMLLKYMMNKLDVVIISIRDKIMTIRSELKLIVNANDA